MLHRHTQLGVVSGICHAVCDHYHNDVILISRVIFKYTEYDPIASAPRQLPRLAESAAALVVGSAWF